MIVAKPTGVEMEQPASTHIISASRRTDIPAFYMPWFMGRLRAGLVRYPHPFTKQVLEVSLRPEHVHSIVFWTKNGQPLLPHVDELTERGYGFACHFTITGVPRQLEPGVPSWEDAVSTFAALSSRLGPERIWWRFDPVLLTDDAGPDHYLSRYRVLASALEGMTLRCFFSFADFYGKVRRRLAREQIPARDPELKEKQELTGALAQIASAHGMELFACCNDEVVSGAVRKAHCIEAAELRRLFPGRPLAASVRPTRKLCGCSASRDIGTYDTCPHQCIYCYANQNGLRVKERHSRHDPGADMLVP